MRFNKLLSATAAVGVAGALALGGAATAHAATTDASTQGARLTGKFVLGPLPSPTWSQPFQTVNSALVVPNYGFATRAEAQAAAVTISIPAVGTNGKIINGSLCLGQSSAGSMRTAWVDCTSLLAVDVNIDADGQVKTPYGLLDSPEIGAPLVLNGSAGTSEMLDVAGFASAVKDVSITGPANGAVVGSKRPNVTGTGEPGASIMVTTQSGKKLGTTIVSANGTWTLTPNSDIAAAKPTLTATQDADGDTTTATVTFTINAGETALTAQVDSVDAASRTAVVSGTGSAEETVTVTGPNGDQMVTVGADGTWTAIVPGLVDGDNSIVVTDGTDTISVTATILPSPIVNPLIAGGAGLAALLALGTTMLIRRKSVA